jgi:hypothetical protein
MGKTIKGGTRLYQSLQGTNNLAPIKGNAMVVVSWATSEVTRRARQVPMACGMGLRKFGRIALKSPVPVQMVRDKGMWFNGIKQSVIKGERKNYLAITGRGVTAFANMLSTAVILTLGLKLVKGKRVVRKRNKALIQRERVILFS